jgi:hypothetical protein
MFNPFKRQVWYSTNQNWGTSCKHAVETDPRWIIEVRPTSRTCKESVLSSCFRASRAIASLCALASCGLRLRGNSTHCGWPLGTLNIPSNYSNYRGENHVSCIQRASKSDQEKQVPFSPLLGKVAAQLLPEMLKVVLFPHSWPGFDRKIQKKIRDLVRSQPPNSFLVKTHSKADHSSDYMSRCIVLGFPTSDQWGRFLYLWLLPNSQSLLVTSEVSAFLQVNSISSSPAAKHPQIPQFLCFHSKQHCSKGTCTK